VAAKRKLPFLAPVLAICLPLGVVSAVAFAVTAKGATAEASVRRPQHTPPAAATAVDQVVAASLPAEVAEVAPDRHAIVAPRVPGSGLAIYPEIGAAAPSQTLPAVDELGSPLVLLSVASEGDWFHVLLPTRPNGSMGWVRAADVTATAPANRVEVSLAAHELRVVRITDGAVLLTSTIGAGRPTTPTPRGEFFVRDHFPTGSMSHPYGPFAFGLSGHSDVFTRFGTGDGRIAIHGTNQPSTIGADASNGCVHVANDVVLQLVDLLPLGTPVIIS